METPRTPDGEDRRIAALRALDVLDTPMEERFDRITRFASQLFDVPIALVSLIDQDRQWFKSAMGLDVRETSRAISFCGHTILTRKILLTPDALIDSRFSDNPLVRGAPYIRFYAGCPIYAECGSALGSLCLIDTKPRVLSETDLHALRDLALMVERELQRPESNILDEKTSICNRNGFSLLAEKGLDLCARRMTPASMVFIEIDGLNDDKESKETDRILYQFSEYLNCHLDHSALVARGEKNQFVALLIDASAAAAELAMINFKAAIEALHIRENWKYLLRFSHGVAEFNTNKHPTVDKLITDADIAMYDNKKQRRYADRANEAVN